MKTFVFNFENTAGFTKNNETITLTSNQTLTTTSRHIESFRGAVVETITG